MKRNNPQTHHNRIAVRCLLACPAAHSHGGNHGGADPAAVADLQAGGLHYVVADARDKWPLKAGWLKRPASPTEVAAARSEPYLLLGHVPYRAGPPGGGHRHRSREARLVVARGGGGVAGAADLCGQDGQRGPHLYYRCDRPVGNRKWEGGEIRCAAGHAVLWDEDAVLARLRVCRRPIRSICRAGRSPGCRPGSGPGCMRRWTRTARAGSALRCLTCAELDYDEWLYVGMGLHHGEHYDCVDAGAGAVARVVGNGPGPLQGRRVRGQSGGASTLTAGAHWGPCSGWQNGTAGRGGAGPGCRSRRWTAGTIHT